MEVAANELDYELATLYRDQISRLRQIQDRQYVNVKEGNADVIGFASQAGIVCLQLLSLRGGQVEGSRSYFPRVPAHSSKEEIISAFLTQHYLSDSSHIESIPRFIVIESDISEQALIENVLSEQAGHKVEVIRPVRGEKKKWLTMATHSVKQALAAHHFNKTNIGERALALQQALGLDKMPHRIECFDISHSMGEATVASCVVFDQNGPIKSDYRRFNIENITPGDDIAAMHQVLLRRFKRLQKDNVIMPDIALIDGGTTQLSAAKKVMAELDIREVTLVGVSKGPDRKPGFETLHINDNPPMHLPSDSLALHFIQQIRDEAHRFAIAGHRNKRDKTRRKSSLELIPGIGSKRRRDLLRYFGGIQGIAHASLDELSKVPGISRSLAERIFAALHDKTV
jgi:excinuclease ABC subunit C